MKRLGNAEEYKYSAWEILHPTIHIVREATLEQWIRQPRLQRPVFNVCPMMAWHVFIARGRDNEKKKKKDMKEKKKKNFLKWEHIFAFTFLLIKANGQSSLFVHRLIKKYANIRANNLKINPGSFSFFKKKKKKT